MVPGPPEVCWPAGFDGVPPVITRVDVLKPRLLDELLEDENPPDELVDDIPEDIENADPHQTTRRSMHTATPVS